MSLERAVNFANRAHRIPSIENHDVNAQDQWSLQETLRYAGNKILGITFPARELQHGIAGILKRRAHLPQGFDTVIYGLGGPDIATFFDAVANEGRIISIGQEDVSRFSDSAIPTSGPDIVAWNDALTAHIARQGQNKLYASPQEGDPIYRGTLAFIAGLAILGISAENITLDNRMSISRPNQTPITLTRLKIVHEGKTVFWESVSGITFPEDTPLDPHSFEYHLISNLIASDAGSTVLSASHASHQKGILGIFPMLPLHSWAVFDRDSELGLARSFGAKLTGNYLGKDTVKLPRLEWGYQSTLSHIFFAQFGEKSVGRKGSARR